MEFRLPDLGEGLADAELVSWTVQVGDQVELNQVIAEVETAKAQVALPSPYVGTVLELLAQPGETVLVGAPLIRIGTATDASHRNTDAPDRNTDASHGNTAASHRHTAAPAGTGGITDDMNASSAMAEEPPAERRSVLVGYGPDSEPVSRRARVARDAGTRSPADDLGRRLPPSGRASATPGARRLAREIGVDLAAVTGSGPQGAVTVTDLHGAQHESAPREYLGADHIPIHTAPPVTPEHTAVSTVRSVPAGRESRVPIAGIRKRTAAAMSASAQHIPQASTFVTTDFTGSMELLDHLRATPTFAGLSLTPLALVAKAALVAVTEFPEINSFWDETNQQILTKHYVNLGIAVASERGLLVPNLKEAQTMTLRELCQEIARVADVARSGAATPADLTGGTLTITNVGVFGVDTGVPLVNPNEAAILCLGSIRKRPWVHRDELTVRWVTTLGLSFDHRLIDGEQGSRFLASIAALLEDPLTLLGRV
ncbi:dihydrolipoamide acetyltransferase family protein [Nocardia jejuensis]|uniref:dihydrolipoamide acetyltransferase family protein n=1 Tax=Nocardia jejuensis TaxID=328049 RepID=UPI000832AA03|nr:dihydrolipoamide acetyltransferase family protein [Nocardia jejuensis]